MQIGVKKKNIGVLLNPYRVLSYNIYAKVSHGARGLIQYMYYFEKVHTHWAMTSYDLTREIY